MIMRTRSSSAKPSRPSVATKRNTASTEEGDVPDEYLCPITTEIMTDPVTTLDGFTYERAAIAEWLRTKDTSPKTGATLESKALIPNYSLRSIIRAFHEAGASI